MIETLFDACFHGVYEWVGMRLFGADFTRTDPPPPRSQQAVAAVLSMILGFGLAVGILYVVFRLLNSMN